MLTDIEYRFLRLRGQSASDAQLCRALGVDMGRAHELGRSVREKLALPVGASLTTIGRAMIKGAQ